MTLSRYEIESNWEKYNLRKMLYALNLVVVCQHDEKGSISNYLGVVQFLQKDEFTHLSICIALSDQLESLVQ